jgi:Uncharacterised methyltransferase family (DUF6094)
VRRHERREADFYPTPPSATLALLPELHAQPAGWPAPVSLPQGALVFDPCCGDGAILDVARQSGYRTIGFELDEGRAREASERLHTVDCRDALEARFWPRCDALVTNPPFSLAKEFVDRAFAEGLPERVDCAFLLQLDFAASQGRARWHGMHPSDILVLSKRPTFAYDGSDMAEYAWFIFGPGRGGRWRVLT